MTPLHVSGVVLPDGVHRDLWVRDGHLTFESVPGAETIARQGFLLPGLVDAHCHVGLGAGGAVDPDAALAQALADRDVGALLLRDAGSPVDTHWLDDVDAAPRIIRAGRHLARTKRYLRDVGIELEPADLPAEAEVQARAGDGWIKLVGDWIDRDVGDLAPEWPRETVVETVRRAHAAGARVAVHTFGEEALPDLIEAGVDSIEHGTGLTEDLVGTMAERNIALVPTLINIDNFPSIADSAARFPTYAARMRRLHGSSRARVRAAYEAGVPIYAGSDAGTSMPHGLVVDEVRLLHEAGMSRLDALGAASWAAREWLGLPGIEEGAPADFVVYQANPLDDLSVLTDPDQIVLKGNLVQRATGR